MTLTEYQKLAYRTANKELDEEQELQCATMGLSQVARIFQSMVNGYLPGKALDGPGRTQLETLIGDILWCAALACTALCVDMDDIARANIDKLRERYPEKFTLELSRAGKRPGL